MRRRRQAGLVVVASFIVGAAVAIGCGDDSGAPSTINHPPGADAGPSDDDDVVEEDAGKKTDAGKTNERDAAGPGKAGDTCSFNWDCQLRLRCECDGDCACKVGARGTTEPGLTCTGGNDCVSGVCLDGPGTDQLCSDECKKPGDPAADCPTLLPKCQDITFVGRVCTREPPP